MKGEDYVKYVLIVQFCVRTLTRLSYLPKTSVCNFIVMLTELLFHPPESCHSEKATSSR